MPNILPFAVTLVNIMPFPFLEASGFGSEIKKHNMNKKPPSGDKETPFNRPKMQTLIEKMRRVFCRAGNGEFCVNHVQELGYSFVRTIMTQKKQKRFVEFVKPIQ